MILQPYKAILKIKFCSFEAVHSYLFFYIFIFLFFRWFMSVCMFVFTTCVYVCIHRYIHMHVCLYVSTMYPWRWQGLFLGDALKMTIYYGVLECWLEYRTPSYTNCSAFYMGFDQFQFISDKVEEIWWRLPLHYW